jgi:hypothetical protein
VNITSLFLLFELTIPIPPPRKARLILERNRFGRIEHSITL